MNIQTEKTTDSPTVSPQPTPYAMLGGDAGVQRLVDRFYDLMETAPYAKTIRAMHGADLGPMRERLFYFLSGWLGGPNLFFDKRPGVCIRSAHAPFTIGEEERDAWLRCMREALEETGASEEVRQLLEGPFFRIADLFRTQ